MLNCRFISILSKKSKLWNKKQLPFLLVIEIKLPYAVLCSRSARVTGDLGKHTHMLHYDVVMHSCVHCQCAVCDWKHWIRLSWETQPQQQVCVAAKCLVTFCERRTHAALFALDNVLLSATNAQHSSARARNGLYFTRRTDQEVTALWLDLRMFRPKTFIFCIFNATTVLQHLSPNTRRLSARMQCWCWDRRSCNEADLQQQRSLRQSARPSAPATPLRNPSYIINKHVVY